MDEGCLKVYATELLRDLEKMKTHFQAFMGDKFKANLRVRFNDTRSVNDLKLAIEGVLVEEWPLIRRATFLSHEHREETFET